MWLQVIHILQNTQNLNTKFFALQVLKGVIKYRWNALPAEQRDGMKNFISDIIVQLSSNEASFRMERLYVNKLNIILVQKDRPLKRRLLDIRLKDDRGNQRDQDRTTGDRPVSSPSRERRLGGCDETMFDAYGGPAVPHLSSNMHPPPSVLMSVPGVGPLGPFFPAPPEVAMQMLRD